MKATPDGRPLASWGARFGAQLIDMLAVGAISGVLSLPILLSILHAQTNHDQAWLDAHPGQALPFDPFWIYRDHWQALLGAALIGLAVQAIYFMGFWRAKQATPGKMAVGLRIEYRDHSGPLNWSTILQRWLVQYAAIIIYGFGTIFLVLDGLWPLWDKQSQALHEKWPKTNVVRTR